MSRDALLKALADARRAEQAGLIDVEEVGSLAGLTRSRAVVRQADDAGLVGATEEASDRTRRTQRAGEVAEAAERAVKRAADGSPASALALRRITRPVPDPELSEMWDRFSQRDVTRLIGEMARRAKENKKVTHNFVAGAVREIAAKHLSTVRAIVTEQRVAIRELGVTGEHLAFLDTGAMGDVFLPTKALAPRKGVLPGRSVELGTDRAIGIARGQPQEVTFTKPNGEKFVVWVQGELEVTVAIEVKGRTVVEKGVRQQEALRLEGRGTGGYAVIDGRFWLLKYDPETVHHVIVAPRSDPDFDTAAAMGRVSGGGRLTLVEIPITLDNQVMAMARYLIEAL